MVEKCQRRKHGSERRTAVILDGFDRQWPEAKIALTHHSAFELLIATILSAQCTDERVNLVTKDLFQKYPTPETFATSPLRELEQDVRPTGFFRNKARSIQGASRMILERFNGRVPETMEELIQLPGVARKTANVVLGTAFGKAEGVVVDTHVARVSRRLALSKATTPEKIEQDLMKLLPEDRRISFSLQAILHGRNVCRARKPLCHICPVERVCDSKDKMPAPPPASPAKADAPKSRRRSDNERKQS